MGLLDGKVVLITGGGNGIGRECALMAAKQGAKVVVNDLGGSVSGGDEGSSGPAETVAAEIRAAGGEAVTLLAREALAAAGGVINILVNNAARLIPAQSMLEATEQQIDQALAVNIKVPFLLTAALVPAMAERGGGVVINMGSINGVVGMSVAALYGASKAGLHSLTKSWAAELAAQARSACREPL